MCGAGGGAARRAPKAAVEKVGRDHRELVDGLLHRRALVRTREPNRLAIGGLDSRVVVAVGGALEQRVARPSDRDLRWPTYSKKTSIADLLAPD